QTAVKKNRPNRNRVDYCRPMAIHNVTRKKRTNNGRQCFGKTDQAKQKGVVTELIDLPTHNNGLNLQRHSHKQTRNEQISKIAYLENGCSKDVHNRYFTGTPAGCQKSSAPFDVKTP